MTGTVLITGAGSGIGRATLDRFARGGWTVTAAVRSEASAETLKAEVATQGLTIRTVAFDLRDRQAADAALARVLADGIPDVVVNNAGVGAFGPVELTDDASIDLVLETNLVAPLRLLRALLPHFRERRSGVIINVSSGLGFASDAGQGLYAASKHAIEGLSEALSLELAPFNVRVAVIEPGLTATDIQQKTTVMAGYGPESPYWDVINARLGRLTETIWRDGWAEDPANVAEAIYAAATDPQHPLFTPVGRDTQLSARLRGRDQLDTYDERTLSALQVWAADPA